MQPQATLGSHLFGALGLLVGSAVFTMTSVIVVGMVIGGEALQGGQLVAALFVVGLCSLVVQIGWRARRRALEGESAAPLLARVAIPLLSVGLVGGVVLGVIVARVQILDLRNSDGYVCGHLSGPLEPSDAEACRRVARECRRSKPPAPPMPRGPSAQTPEGLKLPLGTETWARLHCVYERRDEFLN